MRHRTARPVALLVLALLLVSQGCSPLAAGADPVEVRSEQALQVAVSTLNAVVTAEANNRDYVVAHYPQVHAAVEQIRAKAPPAIVAAQNALAAYRQARDQSSGDRLKESLAVVQSLAAQADSLKTLVGTK